MNNMLLRATQPSQGGVGAMPTPNLPPGPQGQPSFSSGASQSPQPNAGGRLSPNMLSQWLQFWDQNPDIHMQDNSSHRAGDFNPTPMNRGAERLSFAMGMLNPNPTSNVEPNFFNGAPQGNGGMPPDAGYNRLAQLMGRR